MINKDEVMERTIKEIIELLQDLDIDKYKKAKGRTEIPFVGIEELLKDLEWALLVVKEGMERMDKIPVKESNNEDGS